MSAAEGAQPPGEPSSGALVPGSELNEPDSQVPSSPEEQRVSANQGETPAPTESTHAPAAGTSATGAVTGSNNADGDISPPTTAGVAAGERPGWQRTLWLLPAAGVVVVSVVSQTQAPVVTAAMLSAALASVVAIVCSEAVWRNRQALSLVAGFVTGVAVFAMAWFQIAHIKPSDTADAGEGLKTVAVDLRGQTVTDEMIRDVNLRGSLLDGANMSRVNLNGIHLEGAHLTGATLRNANLLGAYLQGADLRGADLREACLRRSDLSGADLRGALTTGADTTSASFGTQQSDAAIDWPKQPNPLVCPSA